MFKQLGLISILIMWVGTYFLLRSHLPELGKTISKHASKNTKYHITYGLVELLVVGLFTVFIFSWFIPNFKLSPFYGVAAILGLIGTVIAAFFPDRTGWHGTVHGIGAYGMAMSLLVMNALLLVNDRIHLLTRIALLIGLTYMVVGTITAIVNTSFYKERALKFQIAYFVAFHIPILMAVYF